MKTALRRLKPTQPHPWRRWAIPLSLFALGFTFLFLIPYPVVINSPGPTFDVLGKNDAGIPLIEIKGAETFSGHEGKLMMTTVSTVGGPGSFVTGFDVLRASLDFDSVVIPVEDVYPPELTDKKIKQIGTQQMNQSQQIAEAVALRHLKYKIPSRLVVAQGATNPEAKRLLREGDSLVKIQAPDAPLLEITSIETLRDYLRKIPPRTLVELTVERGGTPKVVSFRTTKATQGTGSQLGILLETKVDIPLDITFHLQDVGGPSAGTMFALGIVEQLTEQSLTDHHIYAGTGTLDINGKVGPISGIAQKMAGAREAGATIFLTPVKNCDEVTGHIPAGLQVYAMDTFDDAIHIVSTLRGDKEGSRSSLPTCPIN